MGRVSCWPGNTRLDVGKFKFKGGRVNIVIKRTTILVLKDGEAEKYAKDEDWYEIPAQEWRACCPGDTGRDHWWVRIYVSLTSLLRNDMREGVIDE